MQVSGQFPKIKPKGFLAGLKKKKKKTKTPKPKAIATT